MMLNFRFECRYRHACVEPGSPTVRSNEYASDLASVWDVRHTEVADAVMARCGGLLRQLKLSAAAG